MSTLIFSDLRTALEKEIENLDSNWEGAKNIREFRERKGMKRAFKRSLAILDDHIKTFNKGDDDAEG